MSEKWYQELYRYFPDYDREPYTQGTVSEADFIESEISYDRSLRILDIGCGTGRHALELARRGYRVVGLDLSGSMLDQGRAVAQRERLDVTFVEGDARSMTFFAEFEVAIMLCEGGFSLVETDEMDFLILAGAARALKPKGKLIMTAPNAAHMLANAQADGAFDPVTLRESFTLAATGEDGLERELQCSQRYYTCTELSKIFAKVGFVQPEFFAVTGDGYQRAAKPAATDFELGAIALRAEYQKFK